MAFPDTMVPNVIRKGEWATAHVAFEAELLLGRWSYYACKIGWFPCKKLRLLGRKLLGSKAKGPRIRVFLEDIHMDSDVQWENHSGWPSITGGSFGMVSVIEISIP